ncbi:sensor histidine kinase [Spongiimicrobium salis]|uniref:sensor histidine kinase n=1 Tax=Spongiimicrobium salis TaxID=1667022 RepID=UPI00374CDCE0
MRFKRIEILIHVLFWVAMIWGWVFGNGTMDMVGTEMIDGKQHKILVRNPDKVHVAIVSQLLFLLFFYGELYLIGKLKKPKAVRGFVLKSIGLFFGILMFYLLLLALVLFPDHKKLWEINAFVFACIFYLAVVICYGFTKKWVQHEYDKQQLEFIKNQAELKLLRQQLQPHFLFNTMNNLLAMVNQSDNPKLAQSIDKLSNLLRYVVYDTENRTVSIAEEIAFIKNFAELHLLRYEEEEVDFKIDVHGNWNEQPIEPGIFLCYVENAFKHGVQPEEFAYIHIHFDLSEAHKVDFNIKNSISQHRANTSIGGYGIASNQERLQLTYPEQHILSITTTKEEYNVQLTLYTYESNSR